MATETPLAASKPLAFVTGASSGIGQALAAQPGHEFFHLFGHTIRFPLIEGAAARLDLAQFMYQFPLGVFAIALATAIFPTLGREAVNPQGDGFKRALRQGIEGSLFFGLPASIGMILVAQPAVRLLFEGGRFSASSAASSSAPDRSRLPPTAPITSRTCCSTRRSSLPSCSTNIRASSAPTPCSGC